MDPVDTDASPEAFSVDVKLIQLMLIKYMEHSLWMCGDTDETPEAFTVDARWL